MAKANAVTGTSYYVAEGAPVPDELHPDVRLVGPGAPAADLEQLVADEVVSAVVVGEGLDDGPVGVPPVRPNANAPKADWVTYAVAVDETLDYDEADALSKDELRKRYG
jgi:hypothetical protein